MSDLYQPNVKEQLQLLKAQTALTGALHDAQVLQLKMWPLVAFDTATTSEFTWDPEEKLVTFNVNFPKKMKFPQLDWWKVRVDALQSWVYELLGDNWRIVVNVTGSKSRSFSGTRRIHVTGNTDRTKPGGKGSPAK